MKRPLLILGLLGAAPLCRAQTGISGAGAMSMSETPRIKTALGSNKGIRGSDVNVDSDYRTRTITLTGKTTSAAQRALAESITRQQAPGFLISNRLVVRRIVTNLTTEAPREYRRIGRFLRLLAKSQQKPGSEPSRQRKLPFSAVNALRLARFVSARGVTLINSDEYRGKPLVLSRAQLGRDLRRTGSSAFDTFAFAGFRLLRLQASHRGLGVTATRSGIVVDGEGGLRLIWMREGRRLQLRRVEIAGDVGE